MQMIINADDYGKDENATMAIAESFRRGYITQTTLMTNMPWAERAVEIARRDGNVGRIGLHITLSEGMPLTESIRRLPKFCREDGAFLKDGFRANVWTRYSAVERIALREELDAQIRKYISFKLPLMHCDGHHHSHIWLPVYRELIPLLAKYGFKSVRKSVDAPWERLLHPRIYGWSMDAIRHLITPSNIRQVDHFGSVEFFEKRMSRFSRLSSVEIMVHPRFNEKGELVDFKSVDGRLMSDVFDSAVKDCPLLCTYVEADL